MEMNPKNSILLCTKQQSKYFNEYLDEMQIDSYDLERFDKRSKIIKNNHPAFLFKGFVLITKRLKGYKVIDLTKLGNDFNKWIYQLYSKLGN